MNYRKFYEKELGIKLPRNFDVHHIDFDRTNNNFNNLVAIPGRLHKQYHYKLNELKTLMPFDASIFYRFDDNINTSNFEMGSFKDYVKIIIKLFPIYDKMCYYFHNKHNPSIFDLKFQPKDCNNEK